MASNHYVSKRNRRPKNKRRKDYTRDTMLQLRALSNPFTAAELRRAVDYLRTHSVQPVDGMFTFRSTLNQTNGGTNGEK